MRDRMVIAVAGVVLSLGLIAAWSTGKMELAAFPGVVGLLIGTGGIYLESVAEKSHVTTILGIGLIGITLAMIWKLSVGQELFFLIVTTVAMIIAEGIVILRSPKDENKTEKHDSHA